MLLYFKQNSSVMAIFAIHSYMKIGITPWFTTCNNDTFLQPLRLPFMGSLGLLVWCEAPEILRGFFMLQPLPNRLSQENSHGNRNI